FATANTTSGDDFIDGRAGDDVLKGGSGNDILLGGIGFNIIDGGGGTNKVVASGSVNFSPGPNQSALQNNPLSAFILGSFTEAEGGPWSVAVNWGDSSSDTVFATSVAGALPAQPHTYLLNGAYTVTVTVTDEAG